MPARSRAPPPALSRPLHPDGLTALVDTPIRFHRHGGAPPSQAGAAAAAADVCRAAPRPSEGRGGRPPAAWTEQPRPRRGSQTPAATGGDITTATRAAEHSRRPQTPRLAEPTEPLEPSPTPDPAPAVRTTSNLPPPSHNR